MFAVLPDINWFGFAVAAVLSILLAALWFTVVIAKPYRVALGRDTDTPLPPATRVTQFGPVICLLVVTFTSAVFIEVLDIVAAGDAAVFGLVVGVGYLAAMTFQIAINPNFPRPLLYGALNAPFFIATSTISAVVLTTVG